MAVQAYLYFDGNCREAVFFYAEVFGSPAPQIMSYGDAPPNPAFPLDEKMKKRVLHAELEVQGGKILFSDVSGSGGFLVGNNVTLYLGSKNAHELTGWYGKLKEGGTVDMELGPQFFSKLYGFVWDRFGIGWQLGLTE